MVEVAPFGSWTSPISAARVVAGTAAIDEVRLSEDAVWWSESRPDEGGRLQVLRRSANGEVAELLGVAPTGEPFSARSKVHEYGGGSWWLAGEILFFVHGADQRIWRQDPGFDPVPITPEPRRAGGLRYADATMTPDQRWIVCVQEVHLGEDDIDPAATEPVNRLVAVPAVGGTPVVLREVADFVMSPRLDRTGDLLAWVEWSHPNMPWDGSELMVARLDRDAEPPKLVGVNRVAGGEDISIVQPEWDPDNRLWFCSDESDWWNLFHFPRPGPPSGAPVSVAAGSYEVATPPWVLGASRYAFLGDHRVVFAYSSDGIDHLGVYDTLSTRVDRIEVYSTSIRQVRASGSSVVFVGGSFTVEPDLVTTLLGRAGACSGLEMLRPRRDEPLSSAMISVGQPITFPTDRGVAHGVYFPPTNPEFVAPEDDLAPLIVTIHGGPTASVDAELNLRTQYWTTRGFAVVAVNHRGSTGFGRTFRNELWGQWGVADVADCAAAARFLAQTRRADPDRLIIRGGSAGGFTTLAALTFTDDFAAGCSLYGIGDLATLVSTDHKFESRYTERLVAPYPQDAALYAQRSPLAHLEQLHRPVILFHGTVDPVVPVAQTEAVAAALDARGVPHAVVLFEGEGHGFRQSANAVACLEAELSFYAQVLGTAPPEGAEPVPVRHLGR